MRAFVHLAVLTGDLVGSTGLDSAEFDSALAALHAGFDGIAGWDPAARHSSYRGDGWQLVLTRPAQALRAALFLRARLRDASEQFDSRVALACGVADRRVLQDIATANDPVFVASGRLLDAMKPPSLISHASGGGWQASAVLADHVSRGWTSAQARAVLPFLTPLEHPTQKTVAESLGISRQAVGQALDAAGFPAIEAALEALEEQAE
ncbi:MAG: MarR family transcriptional regulator [Paracoccaceae bacterium]